MRLLFVGYFKQYKHGEKPNEFFLCRGLSKICEIFTVDVAHKQPKIIIEEIRSYIGVVDFIIFSAAALSLEGLFRIVREMTSTPMILLSYDWVYVHEMRERIYKEAFKYVDLFISTDGYDKHPIRHRRLMGYCIDYGFDNDIPKLSVSENMDNSILFIGNSYCEKRKEFIKKLDENFTLKVFGNSTRRVYGKELIEILQSHKVCIGHNFINDHGYWSIREYILRGYGAFMISPFVDGMSEEFRYDNLPLYRNDEELFSLIDYYLKNDEEREKIRRDSFKYVWDNLNYNIRAKELVAILREEFNVDRDSKL